MSAQPLRRRDLARARGVSEAQLVAEIGTRLAGDWRELIGVLPTLGRCLALTRNEQAVSEVRGEYGGVQLDGHVGQVIGKEIDLRVFLRAWKYGFALDEAGKRSLQFFDASGTAVHKLFLEPQASVEAFEKIRAAFAAPAGTPLELDVAPAPPSPRATERPDDAVDMITLRRRWDAMLDTHEFFHVLRDLDVTRQQALRLAGRERAHPVANRALGELLHVMARTGARLMLFVASPGVLQVRSGAIVNVQRVGEWLNVLDPEFNLHVREDGIAASWVVRKPTASGMVTSLELFDAGGENLLLAFAKRDDRGAQAEPDWWRELLAGLEAA